MSSEDVGSSSPLDAVIDRSRTPACPWTPWIRLQRRLTPASRRCARAKELSRIDRGRHASRLDYKTVYALRDGYKTFFESGFVEHCHPQGYVNMRHPFQLGELEKYNVDKENFGSSCDAEQTPSTSGLHQSNASSSLLVLGHSANNVVQDSPMLSNDFARARIESPPITPKLKRPTKGEGRHLRFGQS